MDLKKYVYDKLDELEIEYIVMNHEAMFSEKDTKLNDFDNNIIVGKNLFLRNKNKTRYYLVMVPLTKRVKLVELSEKLSETRFSFANENELDYYLKTTPGSVSYLNVITADRINANYKNITYIIDSELLKAAKVGFHPSDNTSTVVTTPDSIIKVFEQYNLNYYILDV